MYYFLKRVANTYSVLDSEDGAIDWVSKKELEGYISDGVEIIGVAKDLTMTPQKVVLSAKLCNWCPGGENIFTNAKSFDYHWEDNFVLKAGGKQFKGKVVRLDKVLWALDFNYGVRVLMSNEDKEAICSHKEELALKTLAKLVRDDTEPATVAE